MRDLSTSLKKPASLRKSGLGTALGALLGLLAFGQAAEAAVLILKSFLGDSVECSGRERKK